MMRRVTVSTAQSDGDTAELIKKLQEALAADNLWEVRRLIRTAKCDPTQREVEEARAFASALPLVQRTCLDLHHEGVSNELIAKKMGCRVESVDRMLAEILADLCERLGD